MRGELTLVAIARALGGEVSAGKVIAPGPGHSKKDRSMVVFLDPAAPTPIRVHSHAGDDWRVCRDYVNACLGIVGTQLGHRHHEGRPVRREQKQAYVEKERIVPALTIWSEAKPIDSTPASTYLVNRRVDLDQLPGDMRHALRWHATCPWEGKTHPAMVALMTDALTGDRLLTLHEAAELIDRTPRYVQLLAQRSGIRAQRNRYPLKDLVHAELAHLLEGAYGRAVARLYCDLWIDYEHVLESGSISARNDAELD